ncbi:hypothetical protein Y032_0203g1851 [Ancylostoma ceylanicum]|nr:hypothetical protein Y032_0203g1851 [Ancylostoma ceylanicum]
MRTTHRASCGTHAHPTAEHSSAPSTHCKERIHFLHFSLLTRSFIPAYEFIVPKNPEIRGNLLRKDFCGCCLYRTRIKWSALINPVICDAPRIRLHLSIVEALNANVPHTVICGGRPMNQVSASSSQTSLAPIYRPLTDGWLGWPRARSNHRPCACAASLLPLRQTHPRWQVTRYM